MQILFIRCLLAALLLAIPASGLLAQPTDGAMQSLQKSNAVVAAVEALQKKVRAELEEAALALEDLRKRVDEAANADADLAHLKVETDSVGASISTAMTELESRYNLVVKRIEELGAPPAEGQPPEGESLASDRKRLQGEKAQMNTIVADGGVIRGQADDLSDHITDLRRSLFTATLFRYTEISSQLFDDAARSAQHEWAEFYDITSSSLDFMWKFKHQGLFLAFGLTVLIALILAFLVRRLFRTLIVRDPSEKSPDYIHRLSVTFWSATIPALAAAFVTVCALGFLYTFNLLRQELFDVLRATLWALVGVYFVWKLARGIVSPNKPQWRLISVSDRGAGWLVTFAVVLAAINGLSYVLAEANVTLDAPVVLTVVEGLVTSVVTGIALILLSFLRPLEQAEVASPIWFKIMRTLVLLAGVGIIATAMSGYIGLAHFASSQFVVTGAIIVTMYIGFLSGQAISRHDALAKSAPGRKLGASYQLNEIRLDQIGLLAGLAIYALVLLLGIPSIMLTWGFRGADISTIFVKLFTEIHIGNINISLLGILAGLLLFTGGFFATRWFQRWLDGNVMARSQIDAGVRNSVNTALGYAGIVIAAVIGVSAAGVDLSSFALVAGALSLGIGFGLQTIVQNFVSGLILLAERPFKVGDWIVNGPVEGFVRRISVRATEVETFQNQSIIVPNSQLINAAVGNWMLHNTLARSEIPISVSYDSDPKQVMELLLEIARSHPLVLTMPEPNVGFQSFGEFALNFELRFYLSDLFQGGPVRNDIRVAIIERFRQEGIVIPKPERNINIRVDGEGAALEKDLANALAEEGLPPEIARRVMAQAESRRRMQGARKRDVELADDNDGSPFDGMHHAERDDTKDDDDHDGDADDNR
ncbi:mechanosensitive ion channel family protein [Rhizobium sp. TH2]|uniref:mechanosensitive ion channel domain-containing protein n=1 Tax=Rhizobium sp. TH2 TaxID=2775403 RepID=UPI0021586D4A|nr:mechanosensitive ion channel domain-containing protein [Rhizobium sp. TH2]UVC11620.1 mechanosensitive ion channel family protein [Rhizobium sp. TH2]